MPKVSTQSPHLKSLTTSRKPMKSPHTPKAFAVYLHTEKPCKSICNLRAFEVAPMPKGFAISLLPMSRECRTIPEKVKHSPRYDRAKSFSISVRAFGVPLYKTDLWSFCSTYEPTEFPTIPSEGKHSPRYDRAKSFPISVRAFGVPIHQTDLWSFCSTCKPMKSPTIPKAFTISLQLLCPLPSRKKRSPQKRGGRWWAIACV